MGKKTYLKNIRIISFLSIIILIVYFFGYKLNFSFEKLFQFTPTNTFTALLFILCLYILKGLSVIFPVSPIFIASGLIFGWETGIFVNILGLVIEHSISWSMGYFIGLDSEKTFLSKAPKSIKSLLLDTKHPAFQCYFLRVTAVLPSDPVSIFLGYNGTPYLLFITYSIIGLIPNMIAITILGDSISAIGSLQFYIALSATFIISLLSLIIYKIYNKKH